MATGSGKQIVKSMIEDFARYKRNDFFENLTNTITNGNANVKLSEHYLSQEIDKSWIEAIEKTIIPLDNLLRTPRKFIKNEEDVVPIALARGITTESVKHLAQHTNLIDSVHDDTVTPNKILEIRKEESYETYENRFILTLLKKVSYFLDKRMKIINDTNADDNQYDIAYSGTFNLNQDKVQYNVSFSYESKNRADTEDLRNILSMDVSSLSTIQRIDRLRRIMYDFMASSFVKAMGNASEVRPPLQMTNALRKNPDYQACVQLWGIIERYEGNGVILHVVDKNETPASDVFEKFMQFTALQYLYVKDYTNNLEDDTFIQESPEQIIDQKIEQLIQTYEFNVNDIRRIFLDKIEKREKRVGAKERRLLAVMTAVIADESESRQIRKSILERDKSSKKKSHSYADNFAKKGKSSKKKEPVSQVIVKKEPIKKEVPASKPVVTVTPKKEAPVKTETGAKKKNMSYLLNFQKKGKGGKK